ncbi:HTTM domain-containing protein [Patulibacter sp.]|uniref:HTTM domain-containing protein n=1 Tax=Patulibacter sp. TaxID=1912859 RepID=UPI0027201250|nr:HTTM domain-containing protein [Patulibacter sp.]MDO9407528.1 HTTM domain-containing protein [Patulibacter sp.]
MAALDRAPAGDHAGHAVDDAADDRTSLGLFAVLLSAALVLHVLWWHGLVVGSPWFAVVLAAAWTVARPTAVVRLLVLLAAAAVAIVAELPALGTHLLLVLVLAGCLAVDVGVRSVRARTLLGAGAVFRGLRPFLRAELVVLYLAAALSKLNADYLDPATSPAGDLSAHVVWFDPTLLDGSWHVGPAIWGSLALELGLPLLLLWPRTRTVALVVGLGFHGVLALAGTVPFTALMLALYVAFLPDRVLRPLGAAARTSSGTRVVVLGVLVLLWVVVGLTADVSPGRTTGDVLASATRVLVAGGALGLAAVVVATARAGAGARPRSGRDLRPTYAAGVVLLVLVAASPYLGHRVGDAFTMYSALDTSPRGWNHEILPRGVRLLGR